MASKGKVRTGKNNRRVGRDVNVAAFQAVNKLTQGEATQGEVSRVMAMLGRRGGKIGGKRRLQTLTQEQRSQIAYKAAQARWKKKAKPPAASLEH